MTIRRWRITLWTGAAALILFVLLSAGGAIMPIMIGGVIAYTLAPLVDRIAAYIPMRAPEREILRRGLAVLLIYIVFGSMLVLALGTLVPILAEQVARFIETLPTYFETARAEVEQLLRVYHDRVPLAARERIDGYGQDMLSAATDALTSAAKQSLSFVTSTLSVIFGYAVVPFILFYAMRDRYTLERRFLQIVPPAFRDDVRHIAVMADSVLGRYIRGQLLLGLIVGTSVGVVLTLLGVPLSLALGVWAGVTELIPIIGPWLGAIPALLLVFSAQPDKIIPVALTFWVVQLLENNLLVPRIQGEATDLHPGIVVVLMVLAGAAFGFAGLIVVLPATAILREMFWYADRRLTGALPAEAFDASRAGMHAPTVPTAAEAETETAGDSTPGSHGA